MICIALDPAGIKALISGPIPKGLLTLRILIGGPWRANAGVTGSVAPTILAERLTELEVRMTRREVQFLWVGLVAGFAFGVVAVIKPGKGCGSYFEPYRLCR